MKPLPKVVVDWKKCSGEATCVSVCPVNVYDMEKIPEYPDTQKSVPTRMQDCIQCLACETQCPVQAIKISIWPNGKERGFVRRKLPATS